MAVRRGATSRRSASLPPPLSTLQKSIARPPPSRLWVGPCQPRAAQLSQPDPGAATAITTAHRAYLGAGARTALRRRPASRRYSQRGHSAARYGFWSSRLGRRQRAEGAGERWLHCSGLRCTRPTARQGECTQNESGGPPSSPGMLGRAQWQSPQVASPNLRSLCPLPPGSLQNEPVPGVLGLQQRYARVPGSPLTAAFAGSLTVTVPLAPPQRTAEVAVTFDVCQAPSAFALPVMQKRTWDPPFQVGDQPATSARAGHTMCTGVLPQTQAVPTCVAWRGAGGRLPTSGQRRCQMPRTRPAGSHSPSA